ncbi:hypothetical protein [Clostridium scatologenes]|uniref:Phage protein n=1 Tax=Clostridium scatologenes TaxID=1548 RepID=A0A0E3GSN0_CLOSL|nr:hypothetical protein [Clostridium scatologenes]AKA72356.1 hypothetical protein CSCA_5231 [Clostridium scatologenes]
MDKNYVISYGIYFLITAVLGYATAIFKKMKDDKKSFYNKQMDLINAQQEALKAKVGEEEYNRTKQEVQDIIYKIEQLGKELAWDAVTKHAKAAEEVASKYTGLSDEDIYNIIKTTVGMMNSKGSNT